MILLMAGSSEAREVLPMLLEEGADVIVTTATDYPYDIDSGAAAGKFEVRRGRLNVEGMVELIGDQGIDCLVDATHPFAEEASATAVKACGETDIPYVRYQRRELPLPQSHLIHPVDDADSAARAACRLGETIFLTTGSKELEVFSRLAGEEGRELLARVLPSTESIEKCLQACIKPDNIIAMKGPFSRRLNTALWAERNVDVVITKESGSAGGLKEKVDAALELGIHLVVIKRPALDYPALFDSLDGLRDFLRDEGIV
jgi:precorrin-6A/cobalt-precorrin-6A reductase